LQEEYLKECEKTINTSVFVQQESAKKREEGERVKK